jgi:hypothetical protein
MTGLHKQVTNRPILVVDDKINDVADRSFAGLDGVAAKEPVCFADEDRRLPAYSA